MAGAMVASLSAAERRRLLRAIARDLRKSQGARIAAQRDPDGGAYAPRKERPPATPGAYPVRFLYPKGSPAPRLVVMKSWVRQGPLLTGFDIEAGGIRSFFWDKVDRWLPVEAEDKARAGGKLRRRGSIRRRAMFRKLRGARYLRSDASDLELWVGFSGSAAAIAGIHQDGGSDRPAPKAPAVRYPRRVLIGMTVAERNRVLDLLITHLDQKAA
ncbi:phage virion morphogenesis (putative tail completion) protein [Sphingomonas laterariae]|uniref:Phage virion morphogenesis (Putative tail completion) protein n=2 Tax=Edaphosphingomonas laterariae TaxID=861865 RepID=A0A239CLC2_9SPHN|nr:phage virion morphogenesis (putative tail completion) protein [Sphingomonas laterariae]